ncbi:MAG TPA: tRNA pseudouridine(55) synthase TruB [Pyrinomonadaceae bacterium]|jgi:tRNA pseudouridine55 synthase
MNGILIIDKPAGITSHDVVARCRRILKTKRVGHTGTLDPFATGVMVVLVGQATRLAQFLDKDAKEYEALVRFGFETDTGDRTGEKRITNYELREISAEEIEEALPEFRGEIEQTPPMYSAKKIAGKKLYELAREGIEIEREPVKITIYELELIEQRRCRDAEINDKTKDEGQRTKDFCLRVLCSAGTYIRVLAEDVGKKLKTGAHLAELRRTRAGKFGIEKASTLEQLEETVASGNLETVLISMNEAAAHLPEIVLSEADVKKTQNGMKLKFETDEIADGQPVRMCDEKKNLIAVGFYSAAEKLVQPKTVLV